MVNAAKVNVLPEVTAWEAAKAPVASRREFAVSTMAQWVTVPVPVTEPSEIEATVTWRPFGDPAAGAPMESAVLLPLV